MQDSQIILAQAEARLHEAGCDSPRREARMLMAKVLGIAADRLAYDSITVTPAQTAQFEALLQRRLSREPIAQILGHQPFWSLDFLVDSHTLIPRADSETLIEAALARIPDKNTTLTILDLGTGSGCLLLTLLAELPNATGLGVDQSKGALAIANANATRLNMARRATFREGNWAEGIDRKYDLVISNPPYIESSVVPTLMPEVAQYEPLSALDGGADGLDDYREITADLPRLLTPGGFAVIELGIGQAQALQALGESSGLTLIEIRNDLGGIPRSITFQKPMQTT